MIHSTPNVLVYAKTGKFGVSESVQNSYTITLLGIQQTLTKAQDLNTAAAWSLGREMDDVPELLKSAVTALRHSIREGKITDLYFWYLHNCDESNDIRNELDTVAVSAKALLQQSFPSSEVKIYGSEIGNNTLEKWYSNTTNKILVDDDIEIHLLYGGYEMLGEGWSAYQSYITGKQLYELYKSYNDDLFSANPRRFLGVGRKTNIIRVC